MDAAVCQGCLERDALIAALLQRVEALEAENRDLRERLNLNSSNSSIPPSANPLDAPKPAPKKKPSGRKSGGQPGHSAHMRPRLPADEVIALVPETCEHCQHPLPAEPGPDDPEPIWHQWYRLPPKLVHVTEYQGQARVCPCCGEATWAVIPADIRAQSYDARFTVTLSFLTGCHSVSRRGVEEIVETLFGVPICVGTIMNLEQETSAALANAHAEAAQAVQQAESKNVDETGWKQGRERRWLWGAATAAAAVFVICPTRGFLGLLVLLGETIHGIITSDRWSVYARLPLSLRQICWAHLKRDFQKCVDRGGPSEAIGQGGLRIVAMVFACWHRFREDGRRRQLQADMGAIALELRALLEAGRGCADSKTATFCANLLALEPALWTFVFEEGVEPTNNRAERMMRRGVLWRKISFGCRSDNGCRFVERMLTVAQTLRLQHRNILDFLEESLLAHRQNQPSPRLLPEA